MSDEKHPPDIPDEVSEYVTVSKDLDLHLEAEDEYEGKMEVANIVFEWTSDMEDDQYVYSKNRSNFEPVTVRESERQEIVEWIRDGYASEGYPIAPLPWEDD